VQTEIQQTLEQRHHISNSANDDFTVINQSQVLQSVQQTSQTLTILLVGVASISLVVGGIGIMNIMLASVLEHLRDLGAALASLGSVLAPGGAIWFEVPDAARFAEHVHSPYHQFSLEHINFFTRSSLTRLMKRFGFRLLDAWETTRLVGTMPDPGLDALFVRDDGSPTGAADAIGPREVRRYASLSAALERRMCERIAPFVAGRTPVAIWGTGSLTLHLLTLEGFSDLNVTAFVDANVNYQGKTIGGVRVLSPEEMRERPEPIIVASHASERDIIATIRTKLEMSNDVVELVSGTTTVPVSRGGGVGQ